MSTTMDPPAGRLSAAAWVEEFEVGWRAEHGPEGFAEHFCKLISPEVRLVQPQLPPLRGHEAMVEVYVYEGDSHA